jgi:hypothetical protein
VYGVWLGCVLLLASDACCFNNFIRFLKSNDVVEFPPQHGNEKKVCCTLDAALRPL